MLVVQFQVVKAVLEEGTELLGHASEGLAVAQ